MVAKKQNFKKNIFSVPANPIIKHENINMNHLGLDFIVAIIKL